MPPDSRLSIVAGGNDEEVVVQLAESLRGAELGPGDSIGELALLDHGPRTATVTADTELTALVLTAREFAGLIEEVPGLAQYQVVQKQPGMLEVRVVTEPNASRNCVETGVQSALAAALASAADLQITFVSRIAAPPGSHKVPLVISELPLAA